MLAESSHSVNSRYFEDVPMDIENLYKTYRDSMFRIFISKGKTPEDAEDLVQVVFEKVVKSFDTYVPLNGIPIEKWLFTIAFNTNRSDSRKKQTHSEVSLDRPLSPTDSDGSINDDVNMGSFLADSRIHVEDQVIQRERLRTVCSAIGQLKAYQKEALELRVFQDKSNQDTALKLGKTPIAVKVALSRARADLNNLLGQSEVFTSE